ncbi:protein Spindly isoform X2 [Osmerus eperlanus]
MSSVEEDEVPLLKCKLKEMEEQLQKSAQYGLQLLDGQQELENRIEEERIEMTNTLEALEQEKYSLQREVELKNRMLESLRSDYEAVKSQQRLQLEQLEAQLERSHAVALRDRRDKIEHLQAKLEETRLSETQLKHRLQLQTEALSSKTEELRAATERAQDTVSSEMMELQVERMELESVTGELESSLQDAQYRQQQLELTNSNLQRCLERLTEEKEEREREAVSCFNALEKAREANQDLQIQLDQVLQQAQDPNSKGNSLFAELEDKRAEMERQLISMKVQHQSLQKQHAFSKQQLHRVKVQNATLMQLLGSRADPAQLERLQSMLSEKNSEIQALMIQLRRLEKVELSLKAQPSSAPAAEVADETYYTDLLKMKLSNAAKDAERLSEELSMHRMKALAESQRALELERKLFSSERALKQSQSDSIRLQLRLEELRHKYEPNESNKLRPQKRRREKIPLDPPPPALPLEIKEEEPVVTALQLLNSMMEESKVNNGHPVATKTSVVEETPVVKETHAVAVLPLSLPQPLHSRTVRICDDPPTTIPRYPDIDYITKTEVVMDEDSVNGERRMLGGEQGGGVEKRIELENMEAEERKPEEGENRQRRKKQKHHEIIHVTSENTMENECAQQ